MISIDFGLPEFPSGAVRPGHDSPFSSRIREPAPANLLGPWDLFLSDLPLQFCGASELFRKIFEGGDRFGPSSDRTLDEFGASSGWKRTVPDQ